MNSKLLIGLALLAILAGGYGLFASSPAPAPVVVQAPPAEVKTVVARPVKTTQIWLARSALQPGQIVTRADLELRRIPEPEALALGVDADIKLEFVTNLRAAHTIQAGDVVWPESLLAPNHAGYMDLILTPNYVPFSIQVSEQSIIGGVIRPGSLVDILALSSLKQNLANDATVRSFETVSLTPILMGVKVLQVDTPNQTNSSRGEVIGPAQANVIVELTRKQVATLTIARHIAQLEIHLSTGNSSASELSANAGDVLTDYKAIQEFRAGAATVR
ncbi:Flp pilus assembly protein CpaB [Vibrio sp. V31_P5A7T61]|uniref:Flp pilus assembly protein CpaB n=1 Tax=unclassified Vibrio TaxID=2614977 RepID=UPI00137289E7|nr:MULTISPECIES: Flp pilus assembly protein CpaB [unclassified Vibrio]NAW62691.1 Flp pilus assembly protein CpaB [Vibrio sp. V31_P5A7T61]NAX02661.1 Flp pilus assembly protein CpaB [Vibrio sp. V34_P3A8T189]NAX07811.1 Flp pilus assembly protein CpaB [Vibrio sp. V40_P2S30T141]NAX62313.1 Flp pilus assembly protein CpaB [Vibrio sp. V32_P6A28T40]